MRTLFYSIKPYEKPYLLDANFQKLEIDFIEEHLNINTVSKAIGYDAISIFTSDDAGKDVLVALKSQGINYVSLRSAGYDHIDLTIAKDLQIKVAHVPKYSPYAIAEHAVALILALNRKLLIANTQMKKNDFTTDHLIGFDLNGKTIGIIGLGKIGSVFAKIMHGFGCKLLGYDIIKNIVLEENYDLQNVSLETLTEQSDIISIHTNLNESTRYMIHKKNIAVMKKDVMIINTSRGACVNTVDIIEALEKNSIGSYGADVYEKEKGIFFCNLESKPVTDKILLQLLAMPNVMITPHQAFATKEALGNIASSVLYSLNCWHQSLASDCEISGD